MSFTRQLRITASGHLERHDLIGGPRLGRVIELLNPPGEETRLVGGAVRNALLGLAPGDIDLATTMEPADVMARAKAAKLRVIPTGLAHGTVTMLSGGQSFEVTTLREDIETDGRHAIVRFGRDFARDAERRDFTMNALSLGPDGRIFDTVGGVDDLARGHVRFIGEADRRIREDYLRILRFFRFHATYGSGPLDDAGLTAAKRNRKGLATLSRERIRTEVLKILLAPGAIEALRVMADADILGALIPLPAQLDRLARLLSSREGHGDAILRLAALTLDDEASVAALRDGLRLTNAETKRLSAARQALRGVTEHAGVLDDLGVRRLLFAHGREATLDALALGRAAGDAATEACARGLDVARTGAIPIPLFGSADLMRRGMSGPALGRGLAQARMLWAQRGFPTDAASCEALLDEIAAHDVR